MSVQFEAKYDSREGIEEYVKTLEGLNTLRKERHAAAYDRKERLNQWIILGTFTLDTCGNYGRLSKSYRHETPPVITYTEFEKYTDSYCANMRSFLPRADIKCHICGEGWDINNFDDAISVSSSENKGLLVGRTIKEIKEQFENRTDAVYQLNHELAIRSDRWIDLTPNPEYNILKVNQSGFATIDGKSRDGMPLLDDSYLTQRGDEGHFNVTRFYHTKCNKINLAIKAQKEFSDIFYKAGFYHIFMRAVKNQYCDCCAPWFEIDTPNGTFIIGWRKSVINIDISKIDSSLDLSELFKDEDVTKGSKIIHAWETDKAGEYISSIRKNLSI